MEQALAPVVSGSCMLACKARCGFFTKTPDAYTSTAGHHVVNSACNVPVGDYRACTHTYSAGFATGSTEAWLRKPRTACNHMQAAAEYQEYPVRRPTNATTCLAYLRCVCCLGVAGVPAGPQPRRVWSLAPSTKSRWVAGHVPSVAVM